MEVLEFVFGASRIPRGLRPIRSRSSLPRSPKFDSSIVFSIAAEVKADLIYIIGVCSTHRSARPDVASQGSCFSSVSAVGRLMGAGRMARFNLTGALAAEAARSADIANSRHPSSPWGHLSVRQNRLISLLAAQPYEAVTAVTVLLQRKSVPSTHMRCRMTASRLASETMARLMPPTLRDPHDPGLQP
jgi:hypothetical protein